MHGYITSFKENKQVFFSFSIMQDWEWLRKTWLRKHVFHLNICNKVKHGKKILRTSKLKALNLALSFSKPSKKTIKMVVAYIHTHVWIFF